MQKTSQQTVGVVGSGAVASLAARRLVSSCQVLAFAADGNLPTIDGVERLASLAALGARTRLVLVADEASSSDVLSASGLGAALSRGATIVDLLPGDPAQARSLAADLAGRGIAFVDAPLHCEHLQAFPGDAAILCGGASETLAEVLPLLERLGAKVVVCGDVGSGRIARAIVCAVAVCNRLVTYECAAMGTENGLGLADMATVLNRCSGANSATARVLPVLTAGTQTADARLDGVAAELAQCMQLARRVGAPALIANQAAAQVLAASRTFGPGATLDDLRSLVELGSNIRFTA